MKLYVTENQKSSPKSVVIDDMIITNDMPVSAGSKMLDGYVSLLKATVVEKLENAGYTVSGKANVGEFAIDLLGESSFYGAVTDEKGNLSTATAEIVKAGDVDGALTLEVNGANLRSAGLSDLICVKPTYGTVSRFGTIPVACSGETICVTAKTACKCEEILSAVRGHDDKDGTSLYDNMIENVKNAPQIKKVAVVKALLADVDAKTQEKIENAKKALTENGVEITEIDGSELLNANTAWNILMCAELCNNVSRYDGIKFGYRTKNYKNIDELYTNSRSEAFGTLLKTAILYGSDSLSTNNYMSVYDKAMRMRRVTVEYLNSVFENVDAVLLPVCSKSEYKEADRFEAFSENLYTAPTMISGTPAITVNGVQFVGRAYSENSLLSLAKSLKEGK